MKPVNQSAEQDSGEGESEMERIKQVRIEVNKRIASHTGMSKIPVFYGNLIQK